MAEAKDIKLKKQTPPITAASTVDMNIIEYLYAATYEEVMKDDKLMTLILNNGFYKQAFCDAYGIDSMIITHNKVTYKLQGPSYNVSSTLEMLQGKTKVLVLNTNFKNVELENINQVTPLKNYEDIPNDTRDTTYITTSDLTEM